MYTDPKHLDLYVSANLCAMENDGELQQHYAEQVEGIIIIAAQDKDPDDSIRATIKKWRDKTPDVYIDFWRRYYKGEVTIAEFCLERDKHTDIVIESLYALHGNSKQANDQIITYLDNMEEHFDAFYEIYKIVTGLEEYLQQKKASVASKTFADYLLCDDERKKVIIEKLHKLFSGAKGKKAAIILMALYKLDLLILPEHGKQEIYTAVNNAFGLRLSNQSYQPFITNGKDGVKTDRYEADIQQVIKQIE